MPPRPTTSAPALAAGFAVIYLVWGSTYLGIKLAVETLPPFLMAGARFLTAGVILCTAVRLRSAVPMPTRRDVREALVGAVLMCLLGNGLSTWGMQWAPSGAASLIGAMTPVWMVTLAWLVFRGDRPGLTVAAGLAAGFAGAALLINRKSLAQPDGPGVGYLAILGSSLAWSVGSLRSRSQPAPPAPLFASGMLMLFGGLLMFAAGTALGEWKRFDPAAVSAKSAGAFVYLTVFGSLLAFTTYTWLLRVTTPAAVSTHAYVNPLVAVLLGWSANGEPLEADTLLAGGLILGAVVLITRPRRERPAGPQADGTSGRDATSAGCGPVAVSTSSRRPGS
jgi:drug/metabolite transporter (DMT)-like permease